MGYHRDTFYESATAFQGGGVAALVEEKRGPRKPHPNRVSADVEQKILDYALAFPTHGAQRVSNKLRLQGIEVGPTGVHGADNGREFCGIQQRHPYELLLAMEDIEHRTTKFRSPRANDLVERMNRTLLDECFRVRGRQTWYVGVDEIQPDFAR